MTKELAKTGPLPLPQMIVAKTSSILQIASTASRGEAVIKSALLAVNAEPKLLKCRQTSVIACIMGAARLGLEVSTNVAGRGYVYLIPRDVKDKAGNVLYTECTLQIGYRGMIELASRSSRFQSIRAEVIRKSDEFEYLPADDQPIRHKPDWKGGNKQGNIIGAWAMATLARGEKVAVVLNREDLDNIATTSYCKGDYYLNHFAQWCIARAIKRLCKTLPLDGDSQPTYSTPDEADDTLAVTDTEVVDTQPAKSRELPKYEGPEDEPDAPKTTPEDAAEFAAAMESAQ